MQLTRAMTHTQTFITMRDGAQLALHRWIPAGIPRGTVVIAHGLGEHAGRYAQLAGDLTADGWTVVAPDHRGHGLTPGRPGVLPAATAIRDDLLAIVAAERAASAAPVVLLGHSMGGAMAAWAIAHDPAAADGLVLSSPALRTDLSAVQRVLMATVGRAAPDLAVGNGLDANFISHDPAVVSAYRNDPLVHDRVSPRLAQAIITAGEVSRAAASRWTTPTLLLFAGTDTLVNSSGSMEFAQAAPAALVTWQRFEQLYHEIFNEVGREAPVRALLDWLTLRAVPAAR
jgi:alpha-beta hydrolase superfamily lysophospholipase